MSKDREKILRELHQQREEFKRQKEELERIGISTKFDIFDLINILGLISGKGTISKRKLQQLGQGKRYNNLPLFLFLLFTLSIGVAVVVILTDR